MFSDKTNSRLPVFFQLRLTWCHARMRAKHLRKYQYPTNICLNMKPLIPLVSPRKQTTNAASFIGRYKRHFVL